MSHYVNLLFVVLFLYGTHVHTHTCSSLTSGLMPPWQAKIRPIVVWISAQIGIVYRNDDNTRTATITEIMEVEGGILMFCM